MRHAGAQACSATISIDRNEGHAALTTGAPNGGPPWPLGLPFLPALPGWCPPAPSPGPSLTLSSSANDRCSKSPALAVLRRADFPAQATSCAVSSWTCRGTFAISQDLQAETDGGMMQAMVILFRSSQHLRPFIAGAGKGREHWLAGKVTHLAAAALRCLPLDCSTVPSVRQPWMVQLHWMAQGRSWQGSRSAAGHSGSQSPVACR